jgi:hypothetical protein
MIGAALRSMRNEIEGNPNQFGHPSGRSGLARKPEFRGQRSRARQGRPRPRRALKASVEVQNTHGRAPLLDISRRGRLRRLKARNRRRPPNLCENRSFHFGWTEISGTGNLRRERMKAEDKFRTDFLAAVS